MGSVLSVDDIEPGQIVALHSFIRNPNDASDVKSHGASSPIHGVSMGVPMRVKGLSLPFVACELISLEGNEIASAIVDVRRVRICKLDTDYVNAIVKPNHDEIPDDSFEGEVPF